MASKKNDEQKNTAPQTNGAPGPFDMNDSWETGGAKVDGWFSPGNDEEVTIKGIVVDFIDSDRSEKLQSDSIVLELTEEVANVKDANEKDAKGKGIMRTGKVGENIAVPVWTQLEGVYERKCGYYIEIVRGAKRSIGKGRSFYDIKFRTSKTKVRDVEVRVPVAKSAGDEAPVAFETN